jgi:Uri superfamily endonuclease
MYLYVGSAQNGLEKRLERHFKREKRRFWHIDYLLENPASKIVTAFIKEAPKAEECIIAEAIGKRGKAITGFGCSDCHCSSHLFRIKKYDFLQQFMQKYKRTKLSAAS